MARFTLYDSDNEEEDCIATSSPNTKFNGKQIRWADDIGLDLAEVFEFLEDRNELKERKLRWRDIHAAAQQRPAEESPSPDSEPEPMDIDIDTDPPSPCDEPEPMEVDPPSPCDQPEPMEVDPPSPEPMNFYGPGSPNTNSKHEPKKRIFCEDSPHEMKQSSNSLSSVPVSCSHLRQDAKLMRKLTASLRRAKRLRASDRKKRLNSYGQRLFSLSSEDTVSSIPHSPCDEPEPVEVDPPFPEPMDFSTPSPEPMAVDLPSPITVEKLCVLFSDCKIKQKKVKVRRSKRIAAIKRKKAREMPPTRRSLRIAAMKKKSI